MILAWAGPAPAQNVGGSIQGTVTDSSGAAIAGATVIVRNVGTGDTREMVTDPHGRYHAPLLPPGEYEVRTSLSGFQPVERRGIRLTVGQDALVNLTLSVGPLEESVVVRGDSPAINLTSGAVTSLVGEREMRDLPLNGRSFQQLALLQPGVQAALAAGSDVVGGRTPKISINGARPEQNNFLLDGTDINNVYNKTPGSAAGVLLGVEAVLEFQVLTNAYSAEFGRSAGGVINAVTRSGSNRVHGSAFGFMRDSALDARNFFDPRDKPKPEFTRQQFGAVLGGPVQKDRTFFFAAYEGLRERLGVTGLTAVPDDNARRGVLPSGTVTLHPAIPAYLETLFPHANGRSLGGGASEYLFTDTQPTDEHFFQGRVDHRFTANDNVFVRYTYDRGDVERIPTDKPPISIIPEQTRNTYVTAEHQRILSPTLLNVLRVGLNRSVSLADNLRTIDIPPSMAWIPGEQFGYLTIRGMVTEMAGDFRLPRDDRLNNWQIGDTLTWTSGAHSMRVGFQTQYLQFDQHTTSQQGGIVNFANLESFLQGRAISVDFAVPGKIDPDRRYRQWLFGFYAQDDIHLSSRVTLNAGLRYEFVTTPTEADGKISNLRNVTDSELIVGDPWHENPSLKNVAPRIGVAWDPLGDGKTSVRSGFGLFYDEILPKYYFFSGSLNPPFTTRTSIPNPPFPNVVANFNPNAPIRAQLQTVNFDLTTPFIMQFNASVQRALPGNWDVMVGYVGSRGIDLIRLGDANLAPRNDRERREGLSAAARAPQPELHGHLAARDRREVLLQRPAGRRAQALLARLARAGLLHAVGIDRRLERHQLAGLQQRRAVRPRLVRPDLRSRPLRVRREAQPDVQRDLGAAVRAGEDRHHGRVPERLADQQHHDPPIGASVHPAARVQPVGQPQHHQLLDARTARCRVRLRSDSRRPGSLPGYRLLPASSGEPARQRGAELHRRPRPRRRGFVARQGVRDGAGASAGRAHRVLQPAEPAELRGPVRPDGIYRRRRERLAHRRAHLGPDHVDGDDVTAGSARAEAHLLRTEHCRLGIVD